MPVEYTRRLQSVLRLECHERIFRPCVKYVLLIFGIISLSATLVGAGLYAQTLTDWWTSLGRYGTALFDSWILAPFIVSVALTLCGILILIREYIFIGKE